MKDSASLGGATTREGAVIRLVLNKTARGRCRLRLGTAIEPYHPR